MGKKRHRGNSSLTLRARHVKQPIFILSIKQYNYFLQMECKGLRLPFRDREFFFFIGPDSPARRCIEGCRFISAKSPDQWLFIAMRAQQP